jgi:hypothetical protein
MIASSQIIIFKFILICLVKLHRRLCPIMFSLSLFKGRGLCIYFYKQFYLITISLVYHPYLPILKHPFRFVVLYTCTSIIQFVNIILRLFLMHCKVVITLLLLYILFMDVVNNTSSIFSYFKSSPVSF